MIYPFIHYSYTSTFREGCIVVVGQLIAGYRTEIVRFVVLFMRTLVGLEVWNALPKGTQLRTRFGSYLLSVHF